MTAYRQQSEEYPGYYVDDRNNIYEYMNHYPTQNFQMNYGQNNGQGVLYSYLNQTGNYMMYQADQHPRRF